MLLCWFSVPHQYVGNNAGGGSHQDKIAVYLQPVVAARGLVQIIAAPIIDNVAAAVMVVVLRHGVPGAELAVVRMPGI